LAAAAARRDAVGRYPAARSARVCSAAPQPPQESADSARADARAKEQRAQRASGARA
jgi:hypothetical protein